MAGNELDINELLEQSRKVDLTVLLNAKEEAKRKLVDNPTDNSALSAFDKASKLLEERAKEKGPEEDVFPSRVEVHKWLQAQGYSIGRSRFYEQCPVTGGLLKIERDGTILASSVMRYVKRASLKRLGSTAERTMSKKQEKKLDAEIEKTQAQVEKVQLENLVASGKYVLATRVEQEQAIKAVALAAALDHLFTVSARESIRLVSGKLTMVEPFIEFWIAKKRELLHDFSSLQEITIEVVEDVDGDS